ncbi:piggyBac transposable element-derived protein 3-like [Culex quinquefasciatus]|uniref:piggyBac transposable element-derived protein 3-like n=1 Tax=Culex quinquefasciatus TaxID=7176 RepID=UPI0018E393E3|nr:piggyBac transposable element-derived protein 3-like [Culex quinquefasciatus]
MKVGDLEFEFSDEEDDNVSDGTVSDIESESDSDDDFASSEAFVGKNGKRRGTKPPADVDMAPPIKDFDASNVGPAPHCRKFRTAKEAFLAFLSSDIIDEIVECTNLYGRRKRESSRKDVTKNEVLSFIAVLIAAGRNHQNHVHINEMWTANKTWRIDFYRFALGKNRFKELFVCLRTDNVLDRNDRYMKSHDKLEPIRKILDIFVSNCQRNYVPPKVLTVDERLCLFRGRVSFRVYIKSKPGKYGIKIWVCATETGYVVVLQIYTGKGKEGPEKGQGMRVVKDLVAPFLNEGREVTADNIFTSVELVQFLRTMETAYTGTMRANKADIPPAFLEKKNRLPGSFLEGFDRTMTLTSYFERKGKKPVVMLSSKQFEAAPAGSKPSVVEFYNKTKGFVDMGDQQTRHTIVSRRSCQWPKKVLFELIDIATLNSHIIHKELHPEFKGSRSDFLQDLSEELAIDHMRDRLRGGHLPEELTSALTEFVAEFDRKLMCADCVRKAKTACSACNRPLCESHGEESEIVVCKPCNQMNKIPAKHLVPEKVRRTFWKLVLEVLRKVRVKREEEPQSDKVNGSSSRSELSALPL